ncbi:hypothetical protein CJU90_4710 [Yarrowia sp. C11]|nr:hypothetical protein CJU90_4710 [Yarrowia sp. C11]KAG5364534.1 hypothetical protein CKK34_3343 [Yarrowia sp. E02]
MISLPPEIIGKIVGLLDPVSFLYIGQTCKLLRVFSRNDTVLTEHLQTLMNWRGNDDETPKDDEEDETQTENGTQTQLDDSDDSAVVIATKTTLPPSQTTYTLDLSSTPLYSTYLNLLRQKWVARQMTLKVHLRLSPECRDTLASSWSSPDGSLLCVSLGKYIFVYSIGSEKFCNNIPPLYLFGWKMEEEIPLVTFSTDNEYMAVVFGFGRVRVYCMEELLSKYRGGIINLANVPAKYSKQFPSRIEYLAVSQKAFIMWVRARRLGGLTIINVETTNEIDVPHFRLDLRMSAQARDQVMTLIGNQEALIFGQADTLDEEDLTEEGALWEYYSTLMETSMSTSLSCDGVLALLTPGRYICVKHLPDENRARFALATAELGVTGSPEQEELSDDEEDDDQRALLYIDNVNSREEFKSIKYCLSWDSTAMAVYYKQRISIIPLKGIVEDQVRLPVGMPPRQVLTKAGVEPLAMQYIQSDRIMCVYGSSVEVFHLNSSAHPRHPQHQDVFHLASNQNPPAPPVPLDTFVPQINHTCGSILYHL